MSSEAIQGIVKSLLKVEGLRKAFGGVVALRDARSELEAGVHALCGGNGAGKSTFLSILMGIYRRDAGTIWRSGKEVEFSSPAEALASGIAIIERELSPIPQMTVAENIFLGREPPGRFGGVNFRKMNAAAQANLDDLGFAIPATRHMHSLSVAQMQLVEIAKALSHDAEVSRPWRSAIARRINSSPSSAVCASRADASFMSRTAFPRSSTSPTVTPCSATARMSARGRSPASIGRASFAWSSDAICPRNTRRSTRRPTRRACRSSASLRPARSTTSRLRCAKAKSSASTALWARAEARSSTACSVSTGRPKAR